jgi:predicted XRE-type DNA-binding protein
MKKQSIPLYNEVRIKWLLEQTNLQKKEIARLVGVDGSVVSRHANGGYPKRRDTALTKEQMEDYLDFCEYIKDLIIEEL